MIGKSIPEYIFIRAAIFGLRLVAPASLLYLTWEVAGQPHKRTSLKLSLGIYASIEAAFFLFVYLPRRYHLQKARAALAALHPPTSREERRALFLKCSEYLSANYPAGWFLDQGFQRDNVVEWLLWALFSSPVTTQLEEWEDEIEEYVTAIENLLGREIRAGYNKDTPCMRLTLDPVPVNHRPFLWYMIVGLIDFVTYLRLYLLGFRHYSDKKWFRSFPPRPVTIFSLTSRAKGLSYWYRPHRSSNRLPVLFLHGIGIGLYPYRPFLADLATQQEDIGIIVPEFLSISSRITSIPLSRSATLIAIQDILDSHSLDRVVLASHSYGTVVTAHIFRSPELAPRIAATLFVDPIPFLLHLPDVAYNFVYRIPKSANEWLMWYFASRDPDVARTLSRHFFWAENVLWKEDLRGKTVAVALSGQDQIVNSEQVRKYLTGEVEMSEYWRGEGLEVLYHPEVDHAAVFDIKKKWRSLINVLNKFVALDEVRN
ncbi:hypothetical protein HYDPIDRAFT_83194 [Hydnomerulius pinastri MD-312]|nr:hypothetical protein HYDPIDRAFT_83194 [Hydnomerulius pinastri MD-312]